MQKRYVLAAFLAVVIFLTALVSCYGHGKRSEAGPQASARVSGY